MGGDRWGGLLLGFDSAGTKVALDLYIAAGISGAT